jgi:hypothetical protein
MHHSLTCRARVYSTMAYVTNDETCRWCLNGSYTRGILKCVMQISFHNIHNHAIVSQCTLTAVNAAPLQKNVFALSIS